MLMDQDEAVGEVCRIRLEIEEGMKAAEEEIRRWKPMPNGGHDQSYVRQLREEAAREGNVGGRVPGVLFRNQPENGSNTGGTERK